MKALVRTITVFAILNLTMSGLALAQAVSTPPEPAPAPTTPEPAQAEAVETAEKEAQLEAAREQMEAARRQMEAAREQIERSAKNTGEKSLSKLSKNLAELRFNYGMPFSRSGASTVLVIPSSEMKAEDLATIVEDMTVMARIIDKQLGQEQLRQPWFFGDFMGHSSRMTETMYLQGYGALFLKKVDFPLSPTQQVQEEEQQTKNEGADPVWDQMKKDIYEPQEDRKRREERPEEKYDAEKVENLKTNIIKALKHASNIRGLKPDESVIATVTGGGSSYGDYRGGGYGGYGSRGSYSMTRPGTGQVIVQNKDKKTMSIVTPALPSDLEVTSATVLIIRAKKSDIDTFSKGDMDFDKFRERVLIFTQ